MKFRLLTYIFTLSLALVACSEQKSDQTTNVDKAPASFPEKPIEVLVGYGAGGANDSIARIIVNEANNYLPNNQHFVIKNVVGGAGSVALVRLTEAQPDGYTIVFTPSGPLTVLPHREAMPYSLDDFDYLLRAASIPQMLNVRNDSPWQDFTEWKDYVENNPSKFKYSTTGNGSEQHIAMEALSQKLGIKATHIPFKSGAETAGALSTQEVDGAVVFTGMVDPNIGRALFSFSSAKEGYEDIPILEEEGIDLSVDVYAGFAAPKNLDDEAREILSNALKQAIESPKVVEQLQDKLGFPVIYADGQGFKDALTKTSSENKEVIEQMSR